MQESHVNLVLFTGTNTEEPIKFIQSIRETFAFALIIIQKALFQDPSSSAFLLSFNCTVNPNIGKVGGLFAKSRSSISDF